ATAFTDLIVDVAGREHGAGTAAQVVAAQAALDAALAIGQFLSYARFHSKLLGVRGREEGGTPSQTTKTPRDFEFFHDPTGLDRGEYACLRTRSAATRTDDRSGFDGRSLVAWRANTCSPLRARRSMSEFRRNAGRSESWDRIRTSYPSFRYLSARASSGSVSIASIPGHSWFLGQSQTPSFVSC